MFEKKARKDCPSGIEHWEIECCLAVVPGSPFALEHVSNLASWTKSKYGATFEHVHTALFLRAALEYLAPLFGRLRGCNLVRSRDVHGEIHIRLLLHSQCGQCIFPYVYEKEIVYLTDSINSEPTSGGY